MVVGCGEIALACHLPALRDLQAQGLVDVVVCDNDPARAEAAASRFGMEPATRWEDAADGATAVAVCVPPGPNARIATAAVERGLHVLCEKPPGRDVAQAAAMAAAAARHPDCVTMIGFNRRYGPLYLQATAESRSLGPPVVFEGRFSDDRAGKPPSNTVVDWITSDSSHAIDLAIATMGFPHAVSVARTSIGAGPDNVWSLHLHCPGGSAVLVLDYAAGRRVERFEWAGPGYDVTIGLPRSAMWARAGSELRSWRSAELAGSSDYHVISGFSGEYRAFLDAIAGTAARPTCDFAYGLDLMRLVTAIREAPSGALVQVPAPGFREDRAPAPGGLATGDGAGGADGAEQPVPAGEPVPSGGPATGDVGDAADRAGQSVPPGGPPTGESADDADRADDADGAGQPVPARPARPVVLLHQPPAVWARFFAEEALSGLERRCDIVDLAGAGDKDGLASAHVVVTGRGAPPLPKDFVDRAPRLGLVVVLGASVRGVQPETLHERGVVVCSTADAVARSVAEHCLMVTLAGLRRLTELDRTMHAGGWSAAAGPTRRPPRPGLRQLARRTVPPGVRYPLLRLERRLRRRSDPAPAPAAIRLAAAAVATGPGPAEDLRGQVVGLVGWGRTARRFAELLAPFDCEILVASEAATAAELAAVGARRSSIGEILGAAKVVSLHKGLTPATRGFLDEAHLAQLRPGAVLVNTARGELVDEQALVERLGRNDIVAALDVFADEPLPPKHPLRGFGNVILTPHCASATAQEEHRMGDEAIATVLAWAAGEPVDDIGPARLAAMT